MRSEGSLALQGEEKRREERTEEKRKLSRLRYIFRTVPNAVVTRRCHRAWYFKLLLDPPHASTATQGTAPATPLLKRIDAVRRRTSSFLLASSRSTGSTSISFSFLSSTFLSLSLSPLRLFLHSRPSFLIPSSRRARARARARNPLPLSVGLLDLACLLSLSLASLVPSWPLLCRLATASRTPFPLPYARRRRPSPAGGRR